MVHLDEFQSTPLMRGETQAREAKNIWRLYFNPLPSYEGRLSLARSCVRATHFNPLPSCEGRSSGCVWLYTISDFNPLPSCEGRRAAKIGKKVAQTISIHSPHTRGDCPSPCRPSRRTYFNPLPSREGRHLGIDIDKAVREFQSTPLMRGETCSGLMRMLPLAFQSTPLTRGETRH